MGAVMMQSASLLDSLQRIFDVGQAFFTQPTSRRKAWSLAIASLAETCCAPLLVTWGAAVQGEFTQTMVDRDQGAFNRVLWVCLGALMINGPIYQLLDAILLSCLQLEWRKFATSELLSEYLLIDDGFYRLKLNCTEVDNPDQRISQDVGDFTRDAVVLGTKCVSTVSALISSTYTIFSISPSMYFIMTACSLIYTLGLLKVFGGVLMRLQRGVLQQEATLRFALMRVREHAESVAFYKGGPCERARCGDLFAQVMSTTYLKVLTTAVLDGIQVGTAAFSSSVFPYLVLAPALFSREMEYGKMVEVALLLAQFLGAAISVIEMAEMFSSVAAQALRVQELRDALRRGRGLRCQEFWHERAAASGPLGQTSDDEAPESEEGVIGLRDVLGADEAVGGKCLLLKLEDITLLAPVGRYPIFSNVSLELCKGESLLLTGESGAGKSSLLRAIGGLWTRGYGSINCCSRHKTFFVPQEPYLCLGTLRDNATYPMRSRFADAGAHEEDSAIARAVPPTSEIESAFIKANLMHLWQRYGLDTAAEFDSELSGGEKQRLGFVRLLLQRNLEFALLDEATSALDLANEDRLYELAHEWVPSYVSVGHRANLERFHTHKLVLARSKADACCTGHVERSRWR